MAKVKDSTKSTRKTGKGAPSTQFLSARERFIMQILNLLRIKVQSPQFAADVTVRLMMTLLALVGVGVTAYLSYAGFTNTDIVCTSGTGGTSGCSAIQQTSWATIGAVPLAFFGLIAYSIVVLLATMPLLIQRFKPERDLLFPTGLGLLFITVSMAVFSIYLLIGLWFRLNVQGTCVFCLTSAIMSILLAISAGFSYNWRKTAPLFGISAAALVLTLIIALPILTVPNTRTSIINGQQVVREVVTQPPGSPAPGTGWNVQATSGASEIELATYLESLGTGATMFGAWWCPHCHTQKELFGKEAFALVNYIECSDNTRTAITPECAPFANIVQGYPTWVVNGQVIGGPQNLEDLATASSYTGTQLFKYTQ